MQRGENGGERIAQLVSENGEEFVLAAVGVEQLFGQAFRLAPRHDRIGDLDRVDHHAIELAVGSLGRLRDEVEEALATGTRTSPKRRILVSQEGITRPVDGLKDVPGGLRLGIRDRLSSSAPDQLGPADELLDRWIR